jgi:Fe-S-cluster containining protein
LKTRFPGDSNPRGSTLFDKTTRWFERARAALVAELPCRQGCFHCCLGLFPVTILDRQEIRRGLRSLVDQERRAIEQEARRQVSMLAASSARLARHPFIDDWPDEETNRLMEQFDRLPCPALKSDGSCSVYAFRPLVCRSMGIPSEVDGVVHGACAVQTSVPLIRVPEILRREETRLVESEADAIARLRQEERVPGEELLSPYAFLPDDVERLVR